MQIPIFASRAAKYYPHVFKPTENILLNTINFTNRERIMIGDDTNVYFSYL